MRARDDTFAEAMAAGDASAEMLDSILRDPDLATQTRRALLDDPARYVPRCVEP